MTNCTDCNKRIIKKSKIYFTDTGLVCSLLGIRKKEEIDYHFLKGSLFETLILNEFLKTGYNFGEPYNLYFWRDNHQKEIDLIIDFGTTQFGIEIKSGETVHEKFFDGLKYWNGLTGNNAKFSYLIYGGGDSMIRNAMNVISWDSVFDKIIKPAL